MHYKNKVSNNLHYYFAADMRTTTVKTKTSINTSPLPPEFEKAASVVNKRIESPEGRLNFTTNLTNNLWRKSNQLVSLKKVPKIREIPSGEGWRWNQAKRRYTIKNDNGSSIQIIKLVPRRSVRSTLKDLPKLKLWQARTVNKKSNITIFWCEKGADSNINTPSQTKEQQPSLDINEFSFLADFMDPIEGQRIWPSLPMYSMPTEIEWDILNELFPTDQQTNLF